MEIVQVGALERTYHEHVLVHLLTLLDHIILRCLGQLTPNFFAYLRNKYVVDHNFECAKNVLTVEAALFRALVRVAEVIDE